MKKYHNNKGMEVIGDEVDYMLIKYIKVMEKHTKRRKK